MNRIIVPALFGGILLVAVFCIMLFQQMTTADAQGAEGDDKTAEVEMKPSRGDSGLMVALQMMIADLTGSNTVSPDVDISDMTPEAPKGWFATPYVTADGEAITKARFSRSPIAKSTTNSILQQFDDAARGRGNAEVITMKRGKQMMAFLLYVPDQFNTRTVRGGIMASISASVGSMSFESPDVFALHHGVPFTQSKQFSKNVSSGAKIPVDYRVFGADVGGMFKIKILTNSSDAAVADLMNNVPVGMMIGMLPEPDPHLLVSTEFQTRSTDLSRDVPGPSVARRAYLLVKTRLDYTPEEKKILNKMVDGYIRTWDDVYEDHGSGIGISADILALLGDAPALHVSKRIEYDARAYLKMDREWSETEDRILSGMARQRIQARKDVARYLEDGEEIAEEVIALVRLLPEYYDAAAVQQTTLADSTITAKELVIRRGTSIGQGTSTFGNCKIELGVRRCTVGAGD